MTESRFKSSTACCHRATFPHSDLFFWNQFELFSGASQVVLMIKNPPANAGDLRDTGSIPGSGRSPGGGNSNPLQCSCLENPMDRGAWRATVLRIANNQTWLKGLSTSTRGHTECYLVCTMRWSDIRVLLEEWPWPEESIPSHPSYPCPEQAVAFQALMGSAWLHHGTFRPEMSPANGMLSHSTSLV